MSKHDEARRAFLVGAAVGAGAAAGAALVPEALAQQQPAATNTAAPGHDHAAGSGSGYGAALNVDESAAIKAFAERLMPGAPGKPGATDANVLNYIDLALAGAYSLEYRALVLPQIIWGLGAWVGVSALVLGRLLRGWQARRAAIMSAVTFASVVALYVVFRMASFNRGQFL